MVELIKPESSLRKAGKHAMRWLLIIGISIVIFIADTVTDLEIAAAIFYVAVILIAAEFMSPRGVIWITAACAFLTAASFFFTQTGAFESGVINGLLSVGALIATAYLVLRKSSAEHSEHEARTQLARMARVNSLGEMTASIAHEVNQPLTGLVNSGNAGLRWLAADPPNIAKARLTLERIISDSNRASQVVARIRSLAQRSDPQGTWLHPSVLVEAIVTLTKTEIGRHGIEAAVRQEEDLPLIFADSVQIQQVLLNMVLNAVDAMTDTPRDERKIELTVTKAGERFVEFAVKDWGHGISADASDSIFDALYTTKSEGMGIGLAVSRSIIERHGGRIWASPTLGGGSCFHFTLPCHKLTA